MTSTIKDSRLNQIRLVSGGPKGDAISGNPVTASKELYSSGKTEVGLWEVTPGSFPSRKIGITEFMYFIAGRGVIRGDDGTDFAIEPGVVLELSDGWTGTWEVTETVQKFYAVIESPPTPLAPDHPDDRNSPGARK